MITFLSGTTGRCSVRRSVQAATAIAAIAVLAAFPAATRAQVTSIDHSGGFDDHADLRANGTALFVPKGGYLAGDHGIVRLTDGGANEAGSVFSRDRLDISSGFLSSFTFLLSPANQNSDGFTFTLQGLDPFQVGQSGGQLGYAGMPNSVAVGLRTFTNNSIGVYTNGQDPAAEGTNRNLDNYGIDLRSGLASPAHLFNLDVGYDASQSLLTMALTDTVTGAYASGLFQTVDLASILGSNLAYVGFTGGTGGTTATQDIRTWRIQSGAANVIPEPGTLALLAGIALPGMLASRRRRRSG